MFHRQDVPSFLNDAHGGRGATFRVLQEGYCFVTGIAFLRARSERGLSAMLFFYFLHLTRFALEFLAVDRRLLTSLSRLD